MTPPKRYVSTKYLLTKSDHLLRSSAYAPTSIMAKKLRVTYQFPEKEVFPL